MLAKDFITNDFPALKVFDTVEYATPLIGRFERFNHPVSEQWMNRDVEDEVLQQRMDEWVYCITM